MSVQRLCADVHTESFTIAKKWKKFKYLASCEWINKMWYVHKMKFSLAVKKSKTLTHYAIDESKSIMLREVSHKITI
jgi:hypothetical protein